MPESDEACLVDEPDDSAKTGTTAQNSSGKKIIQACSADNLAPITPLSPKKQTRLSDFVKIKQEYEDEDEIRMDTMPPPNPAKRLRLEGGGTTDSDPYSTHQRMLHTPSSTQDSEWISTWFEPVAGTISKVAMVTPQSAGPAVLARKRKRSPQPKSRSTVDDDNEEEFIYESIEDDSEDTKPALGFGIRRLYVAAKNRAFNAAQLADYPPEESNDKDLQYKNDLDISEGHGKETSIVDALHPIDDTGGSQEADESASVSSSVGEETDVDSTPEHHGWRQEQIFLNHILKARNEFTLMPSTWAMHFRGIPLPDDLFYEKMNSVSSRPRIYAHTDKYEFRGALNLRNISEVSSRIRDLRATQAKVGKDRSKTEEEKEVVRSSASREIVKKLRRVLEDAVAWSQVDGDLTKYGDKLPPNVQIIEVSGGESSHSEIQEAMIDLSERWCDRLGQLQHKVDSGEIKDLPQAPVIYGLVIMSHLVIIVSMDGSNPEANCHIPIQMNMVERKQQQWTALAIMVTICWARDKLMATARVMQLDEEDEAEAEAESDPDA